MERAVCAAILFACAACGGAALKGWVEGTNYDLPDALLVNSTGADGSSETTIFASNSSGLCATGQSGAYLQNIDVAIISLGMVVASGNGAALRAPTEPGTYVVAESGGVGAKLATVTVAAVANCEFGNGFAATAGTVTIGAVSLGGDGLPSHLSGSIDLAFAGGEGMSGPFDADLCAGQFQLLLQFCTR